MVHRNILLDKLAKKGSIFSFQDALGVTILSHDSLKVRLSRMEKEGWIEHNRKRLCIKLDIECLIPVHQLKDLSEFDSIFDDVIELLKLKIAITITIM